MALKRLKKIKKSLPKIFKTKKLLIAGAILLIFILIGLRKESPFDQVVTASAFNKTIKFEVSSIGKIKPDQKVSLNFAQGGKVVWVAAGEGDFVKKGQVIATLDKERYEIAQRQANQDVVAADAELEKVYDDLKDNNGVESFEDKIKRTAAEAKKNKAFDSLKKAERDLKDTVLTSPLSGILIKLNIHPQEEVSAADIVAEVATSNIDFVVEVDETDVGSIKIGQKAKILLDAYPQKEIESEAKTVSWQGTTTTTGATVFEVKFAMPQDQKYLLGMNGDIQITTLEKQDAIVVPIEAIVDERHIWLKINGEFEQREVNVGIKTDTEAEILSGVKEGEEVVISGFDQIANKSFITRLLGI